MVSLVFSLSKYSGKNEIRILLDRPPNTLDFSQNPDVMAQKILPLIQDFSYQLQPKSTTEDFTLIPGTPSKPLLHFSVARDDLTRSILFINHAADILYDTLSLSKTNWMKQKGYRVYETKGHNLSYLGFQTQDPILKHLAVRKAISLALPISDWIQYKFFNWVTPNPDTGINQDLQKANELLDQAGFPIQTSGARFSLRYLTTPVREGNEMAYLVREALKPIGIDIQITLLETSLFFNKLKRGDFQIFGSRIARNSPSDPVFDFFSKKGAKNYFQYENSTLEDRFKKSKVLSWNQTKDQVLQDLPIIPLYEWKHGLLVSDRIQTPPKIEDFLDESFRFLAQLQLK